MTQTDVISVNPSKATPGSMNIDLAFEFVNRHMTAPDVKSENGKEFLNFIFASDKSTKASLPTTVALLRVSLAALFLTMILSGMAGATAAILAVACFSLIPGFMTRVVCGVCAVLITVMALGSAGAGLFGGTELTEAFACADFAVTGPGNFSLDSRLRVACMKLKRNRQNRRMKKSSEEGFITLKSIR